MRSVFLGASTGTSRSGRTPRVKILLWPRQDGSTDNGGDGPVQRRLNAHVILGVRIPGFGKGIAVVGRNGGGFVRSSEPFFKDRHHVRRGGPLHKVVPYHALRQHRNATTSAHNIMQHSPCVSRI